MLLIDLFRDSSALVIEIKTIGTHFLIGVNHDLQQVREPKYQTRGLMVPVCKAAFQHPLQVWCRIRCLIVFELILAPIRLQRGVYTHLK